VADDRDDPAKLIRDALGIESGDGANCGFIHTPSREDVRGASSGVIAAFAMSAIWRRVSSCTLVRGEDDTNELRTASAFLAALRSSLILVTLVLPP
jgi:hypothetical protein